MTRDTLRLIGDRLLAWRQGAYYWGDAIAYDGLIDAGELLGTDWSAQLAMRLRHWSDNAPDAFDDALAPGRAAVALVRAGLLDEGAVRRIGRAITRLESTEGVPLLRPHVPQWRDLVWVDSIYHVPSGLVAIGQLLDDEAMVDRGFDVALRTVALLATAAAVGHAYDGGLRRGTGIEWTRGIGWALLGLLDVAALDPVRGADSGVIAAAARLRAALDDARRANGMWPSVLGRPDADDETSVAGFWLTAARHPLLPGDIDLAPTVEALVAQVDIDGGVLGVSHDTHVTWSVDDYLHPATLVSPWGQGAALRGLVTAIRDEESE